MDIRGRLVLSDIILRGGYVTWAEDGKAFIVDPDCKDENNYLTHVVKDVFIPQGTPVEEQVKIVKAYLGKE